MYVTIDLIDWLIHLCFQGIEGHVALNKNLEAGYNTLPLPLWSQEVFKVHVHTDFLTLPSLLDSQAALSKPYLIVCMPSREVVSTIFMMVFSMTHLGDELTTNHMRGWYVPKQ